MQGTASAQDGDEVAQRLASVAVPLRLQLGDGWVAAGALGGNDGRLAHGEHRSAPLGAGLQLVARIGRSGDALPPALSGGVIFQLDQQRL